MIFAYLLFFGLVLGLATLPLLPAILEWRRPTDTAPLNVAQDSEVDIRYLANRFRSWVGEHLAGPLATCRSTGRPQVGEHDGHPYVAAPGPGGAFLTDAERRASRTDRVVIVSGDLALPAGLTATREVYAEGSVLAGADSVFRSILACGDIVLGPGCRTLRWAHADGSAHLGLGTRCHGRVSADRLIRLDADCEFERLRARRIEFGAVATDGPLSERELPKLDAAGVRQGVVIEEGTGRWLVQGDLEVPVGVRVEADLIVMGRCRIGRGSQVIGSVKSHGTLVVEDDAVVRGALVSAEDLHVGAGCRLAGPVIAEGTLTVSPGTVVAEPDRPTTVTGPDLHVGSGTVVHGTVWAHRRGFVAASSGAPASRETR